jgi:hypothetical protein
MEHEIFTYQYSASQNKEVARIREKYLPREQSKLELLRELDRRVATAGMIESLSLGVIGCLSFGLGLCFGLGVLSGPAFLPYLLSAVGAILMLPAYPLYRHLARKAKERLTPDILRLSDEILKS